MYNTYDYVVGQLVENTTIKWVLPFIQELDVVNGTLIVVGVDDLRLYWKHTECRPVEEYEAVSEIICPRCGEAMKYNAEDKESFEKALSTMTTHELYCEKNPLRVERASLQAKISELKELITDLAGLADHIHVIDDEDTFRCPVCNGTRNSRHRISCEWVKAQNILKSPHGEYI